MGLSSGSSDVRAIDRFVLVISFVNTFLASRYP
jgi:hypothetical protein